MANKTLPAKAGLAATTAVRDDGRTEFHIKPGVDWVNGKRVRDAKTVFLTKAEAEYDLSLDRVAPASEPVPSRWTAVAETAGAEGDADDGGN